MVLTQLNAPGIVESEQPASGLVESAGTENPKLFQEPPPSREASAPPWPAVLHPVTRSVQVQHCKVRSLCTLKSSDLTK